MASDPGNRIAKGITYWESQQTLDYAREDLIRAKLGHLASEALERELSLFKVEV